MVQNANQNLALQDGDPPPGDESPLKGVGTQEFPVLSPPLSLVKALVHLPTHYLKVLRKPNASTFAEEMGQASWGSVLVQLMGYTLLSALLGYLRSVVFPIIPLADPIEGLPPNTAAAQALAIQQKCHRAQSRHGPGHGRWQY